MIAIYTAVAIALITLAPAPADAKRGDALLRAQAMAAFSTKPDRGYYQDPDPFRLSKPNYNVIGGVNPLSKGGSRNRNKTIFTDADGSTHEITEWTDYRGVTYMTIEDD